jgi:hypothetical protein
VFPYPVYPFRGLVTKIATVEVSAEEEEELHVPVVGLLQLGDLDGFFLPPLVRVREIARRLPLDQDGQAVGLRCPPLDRRIFRRFLLRFAVTSRSCSTPSVSRRPTQAPVTAAPRQPVWKKTLLD